MTTTGEQASMIKAADRAAGNWLHRLSRGSGWTGRIAIILPVIGGLLLIPQWGLLAYVLHAAIVDHLALSTLLPAIAGFAALLATRALLGIAGEAVALHAGEATKLQLRKNLLGNLLGRAPIWTAARPSGQLSGLAVEQVEALDGYLVRYVPAMIQAALLPIAFAAVVFPIDWIVGLLFLATAPLIPLFMALVGWGAEAASKEQAGALVRLSAHFADRLRGLVTLKLFGRAEAEIAGVRTATEELRIRTMRVMRIAFLSSAVLEFFAALGIAGVALYVGLTFLDLVTLRGTVLTLEAGLFCLLIAPEVYQPLRLLAAHYHDRASAKAAVAEIRGALDGEPEAPKPRALDEAPVPTSRPATLALRGVSIDTPAGRPIIQSLSFDIEPGTRHAILGPSGCGKSTLIEAIARLREYDGTILLDGTNLSAIGEPALRHQLAMLTQRPRLFAGTIADNIRLGRPDACDTAVRVAARRACVTSFTDDLPLRLATPGGENGLGLSGGEIQRVALARIYLRDPALVIADEPTAHLDAETETLVLDGLLEFSANRTLIVVTHSAAVAARMDKAWRLAGGSLVPALVTGTRPLERGAA